MRRADWHHRGPRSIFGSGGERWPWESCEALEVAFAAIRRTADRLFILVVILVVVLVERSPVSGKDCDKDCDEDYGKDYDKESRRSCGLQTAVLWPARHVAREDTALWS